MTPSFSRTWMLLRMLFIGCVAFGGPVVTPSMAQPDPLDEAPPLTVGMVLDDDSEAHQRVATAIREELQAIVSARTVRFPAALQQSGAPRAALDRMLADTSAGSVDLVIAVGLQASHRAATRDTFPVPVIAAHVIDPEAQGIPMQNGTSGVRNLTYVTMPHRLRQNVALLDSLAEVSNPALLLPEQLLIENETLGNRIRQALNERGRHGPWQVVGVGETARGALDALTEATDAAYLLTPLPLPPAEVDRLLAGLNTRRIPTVVHRGRAWVERGALATRYDRATEQRARRVALQAADIARGAAPESLAVSLPIRPTPFINVETANRLGRPLPASVRLRATLIGRPASSGEAITFARAIREGLRSNRPLKAERAGLKAVREGIQIERADLLPQVLLTGRATRVNEAQAAASFGAQPERSLNVGGSFSQTLLSPQQFAEKDVAERQALAAESNVEAAGRDVALQVAGAYVGVLRAEAIADVQRENLALARENLELAQARRESGQVGRREVLRFETQIAQTRQALVQAEAGVRVARNRLKQLLARPLSTSITVAPLTTRDTTLTLTEDLFARYGRSRQSLEALMQALTTAGLDAAPELRALSQQIAAARRGQKGAQQSYWMPNVALEGGIDSRVLDGGVAADGISLPADAPFPIPQPPLTNWQVGLSLQFPLFTGRKRDGQVDQARARVQELTYRRDDLRARLEEVIRARTEQTAAAYRSLREAEAAADAGEETLDLVQTSYGAGIADVLDLIDAQNAVLSTRLAEANARYTFLLRLIQTERAVARTGPLQSPDERAAFRMRLRQAVEGE